MNELQVVERGIFNLFSFLGDNSGCGHIRVIFPYLYIPHLRAEGYKFGAQYSSYFIDDLNFYKQFTLVQFQRSATKDQLNMIKHFKNQVQKFHKIAIVYEIDDLLTEIPEWNFACAYYKENLKHIEEMMQIVDGITVSTEYLKNIYTKYNSKIAVVPNRLCKMLWGEIEPAHERREPNKKIRIGYHGSGNHFCDSRSKEYKDGIRGGDFNDKLLNYIRKTVDDVQWVFSGAIPPELNDVRDKIEYHNWVNVLEFPSKVKSHKLDICLAPLIDNIFNRSKSNIKLLESVALGIPIVCSDLESYKESYLKTNDDDEFIGYMEKLVADQDFRRLTFEKNYDTIGLQDKLWWEGRDRNYSNVYKYVDSYLSLFGKRLKDGIY